MAGSYDYDDFPEDDRRGLLPPMDEYDEAPRRTRAKQTNKSEAIMVRHFQEKERVKQRMLRERDRKMARKDKKRNKGQKTMKHKTMYSPYKTNLVAETERIDEKTSFKLKEEERRERSLARKKAKVKNSIILKALGEESDLNALRQEKRAIAEEEKRLRALLDLEKAKLRRKQDLMAAQRAERARHQAKLAHRRALHNNKVKEQRARELAMLRDKLDVPPEPEYGMRVGAGLAGPLGGALG